MRAIFTQKYSQNQERFVGKTNSLEDLFGETA